MASPPNRREPPDNYTAYLVRLWQDSAGEPWRASAQSAHTGETVRFASVAELCAFLKAQTLARSTEDGP